MIFYCRCSGLWEISMLRFQMHYSSSNSKSNHEMDDFVRFFLFFSIPKCIVHFKSPKEIKNTNEAQISAICVIDAQKDSKQNWTKRIWRMFCMNHFIQFDVTTTVCYNFLCRQFVSQRRYSLQAANVDVVSVESTHRNRKYSLSRNRNGWLFGLCTCVCHFCFTFRFFAWTTIICLENTSLQCQCCDEFFPLEPQSNEESSLFCARFLVYLSVSVCWSMHTSTANSWRCEVLCHGCGIRVFKHSNILFIEIGCFTYCSGCVWTQNTQSVNE